MGADRVVHSIKIGAATGRTPSDPRSQVSDRDSVRTEDGSATTRRPDPDTTVERSGPLTGRKAVVNLVGFAVGVGLFVWIVVRAVEGGDWERIRTASPWLVVTLLACTAVSALATSARARPGYRPYHTLVRSAFVRFPERKG